MKNKIMSFNHYHSNILFLDASTNDLISEFVFICNNLKLKEFQISFQLRHLYDRKICFHQRSEPENLLVRLSRKIKLINKLAVS